MSTTQLSASDSRRLKLALACINNRRQGQPGFDEAERVAGLLAAIERSWQSAAWEPVE